jgi:hypothetical protein
MFFYEREFKAYVILGNPNSKPIWHWNQWRAFAAQFDPIFAACRDKALVRSGQFNIDSRKELKFGRLGWGPKSEAKWVHASPFTAEVSKQWLFLFTEASAPSLAACGRDGVPPDFFIVVSNEEYVTRQIPVQFNPRIFLAIAKDLPPPIHQQVEAAVRLTSRLVNARLVATIQRPWGFKFGSGFTHAIQDIAHGGLFKVGQPHTRPVDLATLAETWQAF